MTKNELKKLGFKQRGSSAEGYWFELRQGRHVFLTNDSLYNRDRDKWHVGYYYNSKNRDEPFWFSNRLKNPNKFKPVFEILTGKNFKLKK